ncbi:MAG TPA: RNA polymerase sigma factor [Candidatus Kapabacteria bacterium]|nr:RNA polymerase sigma factor [Candidatus Kapabacteria bacterium]HPU23806.1 RNA polymerase sigma factor [Candidatus Kapabacteria bacterium]
MIDSEDKNIIEEYITNGSNNAATRLIRKYEKFVFAIALRYVASYDDAEDLTQEVFIKVLNNLKKFKQDSSLKTWLYRITVNACITFVRKKKITSFFRLDDNSDVIKKQKEFSPEQYYIADELERKFLNELTKLPEKQRETFALRYFDNLSYEEISQLLGTSVGGLKANYFQAIKKLSEKLKSEI